MLPYCFLKHGSVQFFLNKNVISKKHEIKTTFFMNQIYQAKIFSENLASQNKKISLNTNNFKIWFYKNSISNKSKFNFNQSEVISQSFLSCQKLREIGFNYKLEFGLFDMKIKYHSKNVRFYNNGIGLCEKDILLCLKILFFPIVLKNDSKKHTKNNNNLQTFYGKNFITTEYIRIFSKILYSPDLFIFNVDINTSRVFISRFPFPGSGSFTIFNIKLENKHLKDFFKMDFYLQTKKNIYFKPSWINFTTFLLDANKKLKSLTSKEEGFSYDKSFLVLSSFKFISKKDYFTLFEKVSSKWNFPLCMVHLNYFFDNKIDIIIFIPRYHNSSFLRNNLSLNTRDVYTNGDNRDDFFMKKFLSKSFSFGTEVIKTQTLLEPKILQNQLEIEEDMKKNVLRKTILLFSNFANKNSLGYEFLWMVYGYNLKANFVKDSYILKNFSHLLRFFSTKSDNSLISLEEYVSGMKIGQKEVFYFLLKKKNELNNHPELEILNKKGVEVLLLFNKIDEIIIKMVENNQRMWMKKKLLFIEVGTIEFYERITPKNNKKTKKKWSSIVFLGWFSKEINKKFFKIENSYDIISYSSNIIFPKDINKTYSDESSILFKKNFKSKYPLIKNENLILKINGSNNLIRILNHYLKTKKTKKFSKEIGNLIWEISIIKSGHYLDVEDSFLKRFENILTLFVLSINSKV
jgi:HSP90 family molecular chaperone